MIGIERRRIGPRRGEQRLPRGIEDGIPPLQEETRRRHMVGLRIPPREQDKALIQREDRRHRDRKPSHAPEPRAQRAAANQRQRRRHAEAHHAIPAGDPRPEQESHRGQEHRHRREGQEHRGQGKHLPPHHAPPKGLILGNDVFPHPTRRHGGGRSAFFGTAAHLGTKKAARSSRDGAAAAKSLTAPAQGRACSSRQAPSSRHRRSPSPPGACAAR